MICQQTTDWIWETPRPDESPPSPMATHLESCEVCMGEIAARRAVAARLRALRKDEDSAPSPGLDQMVLDAATAATAARESGDYGTLRNEVHDEFAEGLGATLTSEMRAMMSGDFEALQSFDDISDEIAESIAEDYGAEIAALTTGRLQVADGPPPDSLPQSPRAARRPPRPNEQDHPSVGSGSRRALLVAALVVGAASSGFLAGRMTAPQTSRTSASPPVIQTAGGAEQAYILESSDRVSRSEGAPNAPPKQVNLENTDARVQPLNPNSSSESRPGR